MLSESRIAKSYSASPARERVRNVEHLVAVAEPNDLGEVVLDDPEVVAVVVDVGRQQQRVAAADDALLALIGRAPVHFDRELVGLDDLGRLGEPLPHLGEKGEVSAGGGGVVHEPGVGELARAALDGALDEGAGAGIVPAGRAGRRLRVRRRRSRQRAGERDGERGGGERAGHAWHDEKSQRRARWQQRCADDRRVGGAGDVGAPSAKYRPPSESNIAYLPRLSANLLPPTQSILCRRHQRRPWRHPRALRPCRRCR